MALALFIGAFATVIIQIRCPAPCAGMDRRADRARVSSPPGGGIASTRDVVLRISASAASPAFSLWTLVVSVLMYRRRRRDAPRRGVSVVARSRRACPRAGNVSGRAPSASLERVPRRRGHRREHRVRRARERRARVVDDLDVDRRRVLRPQDPERADGEVVHLAGVGVDREPLGEHPARAPCARRRSRRTGARSRRAGRRRRRAPARRAIRPASSIATRRRRARRCRPLRHVSSRTAAARPSRDERGAVDARGVQRALDQHGALGPADRAQGRRRSAARDARRARPLGPTSLERRTATRSARRTAPDRPATAPPHVDRRAVEPRGRGDRRPLGPEADDVLAREHDAHRAPGARRRARARRAPTRGRGLAAERAAVGQRRRGVAARARTTTRRARGTRARPNRSRGARHPSTGVGQRQRRDRVDGGAPALHLARERTGLEQRLGDDPREARGLDRRRPTTRAAAAPRPARRAARRRRRTRRRPAARGARRPARRRLRARPAARPRPGRASLPTRPRASHRVVDRLPARAPAEVRGERAVEVDPARLALGLRGREAHEDPRRAEAALRATGGDEARGEVVAHRGIESFDGDDRAARRRASRA